MIMDLKSILIIPVLQNWCDIFQTFGEDYVYIIGEYVDIYEIT